MSVPYCGLGASMCRVSPHQCVCFSPPAADTLAEAEDGGECRPLDASGYSGDHDASPKPAARAKDKRPIRSETQRDGERVELALYPQGHEF